MKVAVVITVKNEVRLLRQNITYHLGIGIDTVFVYFDQTTDDTPKTINDIKQVETNTSVSIQKYKDKPYLKKFLEHANKHHTARQCLNTYDALQKCKQEGFDWLISLDADELFITENLGAQPLPQFFTTDTTDKYDIIQLPTLEVVNRKMAYHNVMAEEAVFKKQKNFASKFDQLYRKIYNPYTKKHLTSSYWLGHTMGKAAINVQSDVVPYNVHRYKLSNGSKPTIMTAGNILHYHLYDFEDFLKKYDNFKDHPDTFLSGNKIETLKSLLIKLVNDPNNDKNYLRDYYEKYIHFSQKDLNRLHKTRIFNILRRKEEAVVIVKTPSKVLS
tara:strand:+ start:1439 stop:2428 length:990 start_codon:yes stop_codon:yes gene_type:complete